MSIEIVLSALSHVIDGRGDVIAAVNGRILGKMCKHLNAKAAIEIISDALPPRTPNDLRGQTPRGPRLRHYVVRDLPCAREQLITRHDLVDHTVLQRFLR